MWQCVYTIQVPTGVVGSYGFSSQFVNYSRSNLLLFVLFTCQQECDISPFSLIAATPTFALGLKLKIFMSLLFFKHSWQVKQEL